MKRLRAEYPKTNFTYYADNRYAPYGNLTKDELEGRVLHITRMLFSMGAEHVVWACNTASTNCLSLLNGIYGYKVTGILPQANKCDQDTLVMFTPLTARSLRAKECLVAGATAHVDSRLAALIEGNRFHPENLRTYLSESLSVYHKRRVILGCTHYVYVKSIIEDVMSAETDDCYDDASEAVIRAAVGMRTEGCGEVKFIFSGEDEGKDYEKLLHGLEKQALE